MLRKMMIKAEDSVLMCVGLGWVTKGKYLTSVPKTSIDRNLKTVEMMSKKTGKLLIKLFLQKQKKQNRCRNLQSILPTLLIKTIVKK